MKAFAICCPSKLHNAEKKRTLTSAEIQPRHEKGLKLAKRAVHFEDQVSPSSLTQRVRFSLSMMLCSNNLNINSDETLLEWYNDASDRATRRKGEAKITRATLQNTSSLIRSTAGPTQSFCRLLRHTGIYSMPLSSIVDGQHADSTGRQLAR